MGVGGCMVYEKGWLCCLCDLWTVKKHVSHGETQHPPLGGDVGILYVMVDPGVCICGRDWIGYEAEKQVWSPDASICFSFEGLGEWLGV